MFDEDTGCLGEYTWNHDRGPWLKSPTSRRVLILGALLSMRKRAFNFVANEAPSQNGQQLLSASYIWYHLTPVSLGKRNPTNRKELHPYCVCLQLPLHSLTASTLHIYSMCFSSDKRDWVRNKVWFNWSLHWLNESNISWASCKAIIQPLIKVLLSHLSGQGGQLAAYKLGDVDYIFLSSVFLGSFNSMPVMAPQAHALTYFHRTRKPRMKPRY